MKTHKIGMIGLSIASALAQIPSAQADQYIDFSAKEIAAINTVVQAPTSARALLLCPKELATATKSGAIVVGGTRYTSYFGQAYTFHFAKDEMRVWLTVQLESRTQEGRVLDPPKIDCSLFDATDSNE